MAVRSCGLTGRDGRAARFVGWRRPKGEEERDPVLVGNGFVSSKEGRTLRRQRLLSSFVLVVCCRGGGYHVAVVCRRRRRDRIRIGLRQEGTASTAKSQAESRIE